MISIIDIVAGKRRNGIDLHAIFYGADAFFPRLSIVIELANDIM